MARRSERRSSRCWDWDLVNSLKEGKTTSWGVGVWLRRITRGGGLVDLRGLCTWLGGVVENSTGVVGIGGGEELLEFGIRLFLQELEFKEAKVGFMILLISSNSSSEEWLPPSISRLWQEKMEGTLNDAGTSSSPSLDGAKGMIRCDSTSRVKDPGVLEGRGGECWCKVGLRVIAWPPASSSVRSMVSVKNRNFPFQFFCLTDRSSTSFKRGIRYQSHALIKCQINHFSFPKALQDEKRGRRRRRPSSLFLQH